jgi:LPXTG-motif cell wall-anchored protein
MPPQPVMPQMQPMAVPMPVAPQVELPKTGKSKFLVPLIILGGLFLIAVGLILFFALKH